MRWLKLSLVLFFVFVSVQICAATTTTNSQNQVNKNVHNPQTVEGPHQKSDASPQKISSTAQAKPQEDTKAPTANSEDQPKTYSDRMAYKSLLVSVIGLIIAGIVAFIYALQAFLMRQTLVGSNEAFVFCPEQKGAFESTQRLALIIQPLWKNTGNTPTRNANFFVASFVSYDDTTPTDEIFHKPDRFFFGTGLVGPQATYHGAGARFTIQELEDCQKGKARLFWWCWCDYESVFRWRPVKRTERFCELVILGDIHSGAQFRSVEIGPHNAADSECLPRPPHGTGAYHRKIHDPAKATREAMEQWRANTATAPSKDWYITKH